MYTQIAQMTQIPKTDGTDEFNYAETRGQLLKICWAHAGAFFEQLDWGKIACTQSAPSGLRESSATNDSHTLKYLLKKGINILKYV